MSLDDCTVGQLLERLAGLDPSAGGGTASLVSAAQGASLLAKAAAVTQKKEPVARLEELRREAVEGGSKLLQLAQADGQSYAGLLAAYRLPAGDERLARIQQAVELTVETPLQAATLCGQLSDLAGELLALSKKSIHADVAAGALLLWTGMRGCLLNAMVNARLMSDAGKAGNVRRRCDLLMERGQSALQLLSEVESDLP